MSKIVKISVFGPKPYGISAFDSDSSTMSRFESGVTQVLQTFYREDKIVLGLTGLSLGLEQEFARLCQRFDYEYNAYTAFDNPEKCWKDLPTNLVEKYRDLLDEAKNVISVNSGAYSPKKCLQKQLKILTDSDYVIYVSGFLPIKNPKIQFLVETKSITVIPI